MTPRQLANHELLQVFGKTKALNTYKALSKYDYVLGKGGHGESADEITVNSVILMLLAIIVDFNPSKNEQLSRVLQYKSEEEEVLFEYLVELFKTDKLTSISYPAAGRIDYVVVTNLVDVDVDTGEMTTNEKMFTIGKMAESLRKFESSIRLGFLFHFRHQLYGQPVMVWGDEEQARQIRKEKIEEWERNEPSLETILQKLDK